MAEIITRKEHTSGIPLGGIGTGSVELCSDGEFHSWQISNQKRITTVCFEKEVDDGENSTGEIPAEIGDRLGHHIRWGAHPAQNRGGEGYTCHRQKKTGGQTHGHIRVDGNAHIFVILRAEDSRDDNTGTHGNAVEETHNHMDQTAGGTDGCQRGITDEFTHDPGVEGMIKLLKNIAEENRQRKQKHLFPDGALCQCVTVSVQENPFFLKVAVATIMLYAHARKLSSFGKG